MNIKKEKSFIKLSENYSSKKNIYYLVRIY